MDEKFSRSMSLRMWLRGFAESTSNNVTRMI